MEFDILLPLFIFIPVITCIILLVVWKRLRPKFPVRVTCWFCGERTTVPWGNKNCWDCPDCEQYNGFDQTGDYNKPIPAQYDDRLNDPAGCAQEEFISRDELLCHRCSQNQLLKVKQLANFVPYSEKNYDAEIEAFERHLEKVYQLCLSCQTRVQQELQIQNEALAKRLNNLNVSNASFSSTRKNNSFQIISDHRSEHKYRLKSSFILHGVSLACAALLTLGKLQLDSQFNMITSLTSLYPIIVWLDRHIAALAMIGLFSSLVAKLFLGKYRLHIIDVISCPVWLLVLLLQTGYIQVQQSWYDIISSVANMLTCVVCLGINRNRRNIANMSMTRLSLDPSDSRQSTTVSQFSSVSQPVRYSSQSKHFQSLARSHGQSTDQSCDSLDDTLTDLDSITLGSPAGIKRTDSQTGLYATAGQSNSYSNLQNQSVSQSLRKTRPLISPATFSPDSSTPPRNGSSKFGLFSTPQEQRQTSFTDQPLSGMTLTSRSFSVPKATTYGSTPYNITPEKNHISSRSLFDTKYLNGKMSSFSHGKTHSESSFTAYRDGKAGRRNVVRKDMFADKDNDDDKVSSYSASTQCPVDSTTSSTYLRRNEPFWKHPGLIGFILGGSVVANILLLVNYLWKSSVM